MVVWSLRCWHINRALERDPGEAVNVSRKAATAILEKIGELSAQAEKELRQRNAPGTSGHSRYFLTDGRLSADGTLEIGNSVLAQLQGVLKFYADGAK